MTPPLFPYTAIVGQGAMQRALIFNAIDPSIGGVLISGTRGTAKSTAVRSLAALLPEIEVLTGDPFNSAPAADRRHQAVRMATPFVNLPIGATEDNVLGTLDIERVLKTGERRFTPGLLAKANRGMLYVDEVNLLPDHLVDCLLDAVAMGVNRVEREGLSFEHEARVILVGTMNPEEGELRPQLLDRFGLCAGVNGHLEPEERKEVVRRRIAFDADPHAFVAHWTGPECDLGQRIAQARACLAQVRVPEERLDEIAELCAAARVEGLRADIVIYKTVCTIAAFEGRGAVTSDDVREAQALALAHRRPATHPTPPPNPPPPRNVPGESSSPSPPQQQSKDHKPGVGGGAGVADHAEQGPRHFPIGPGVNLALLPQRQCARAGARHGKRTPARSCDRRGAFVRAVIPRAGKPLDLAIDATVRTAVREGACNGEAGACALEVLPRHWRVKQHRTRMRNLIVFVVDASGSMAASARMRAAKGAVCALLEEAYQKRDYLSLIAFRGEGATRLLPPTRSAVLAYQRLAELPAGGRTPLAQGLRLARAEIERERCKDASLHPFLVLVSDGRATVPEGGALVAALAEADRLREQQIHSLVIDTETGWLRLRQAQRIGERLGAIYRHISDLPPKAWSHVVREWVAAGERILPPPPS